MKWYGLSRYNAGYCPSPTLTMKETSMGEMRLIDAPPCSISDMNVFNEDQTKFDSSCSITDNVKEALDLEHLFDKN